jgi:hypothetical protein
MSLPAAADDFPRDIPARKPGLWEMRTIGTVGPNQIKALKKYCLDARADRALLELDILRKQLQVIYHDVSCPAPKISLNGRVMTGEMTCRTNAPDDDEASGQDFLWTTTFHSDTDVVVEEKGFPRDVMLLIESDMVDEQRWIGECPVEMEPGDLVDLGFHYNSDSWPDQPRADNIYESRKVVEKMLNEAIEINKRLGPM